MGTGGPATAYGEAGEGGERNVPSKDKPFHLSGLKLSTVILYNRSLLKQR